MELKQQCWTEIFFVVRSQCTWNSLFPEVMVEFVWSWRLGDAKYGVFTCLCNWSHDKSGHLSGVRFEDSIMISWQCSEWLSRDRKLPEENPWQNCLPGSWPLHGGNSRVCAASVQAGGALSALSVLSCPVVYSHLNIWGHLPWKTQLLFMIHVLQTYISTSWSSLRA